MELVGSGQKLGMTVQIWRNGGGGCRREAIVSDDGDGVSSEVEVGRSEYNLAATTP